MASNATGISGAELKVSLQGLGIPPAWFADYVNVTMRTVVRWFDGDAVSPEIAAAVDKLEESTLVEMRKMLKQAGEGEHVKLRTYRTDKDFGGKWPSSWHRALTYRVKEHLERQGKRVEGVYR